MTPFEAADETPPSKMKAVGVNVFCGPVHAVKEVDLPILEDEVTALIGPSGCGTSTLLRCFNRMNDTIDSRRVTGNITLNGEPIYERRAATPSQS
jgi:phosphate transport system ATP-binding protein